MYIYALSLNKKKITETKHGTVFFFLPPKQHVFFVYYLVPGFFPADMCYFLKRIFSYYRIL